MSTTFGPPFSPFSVRETALENSIDFKYKMTQNFTNCLLCSKTITEDTGLSTETTRKLISIIKKNLLKANEPLEALPGQQEETEKITIFCSVCIQMLQEWHVIDVNLTVLLCRSRSIKCQIIKTLLEHSDGPSEAKSHEFLHEFVFIKKSIFDEYRPTLTLDKLSEISIVKDNSTETKHVPVLTKGRRKWRIVREVNPGQFEFAGKYFIRRTNQEESKYECEICGAKASRVHRVCQHIRKYHMSAEELLDFYRKQALKQRTKSFKDKTSENPTLIKQEAPQVPQALTDELKPKPQNLKKGKRQIYKLVPCGPNEYLYGDQVRISLSNDGGTYKCETCGTEAETLNRIRLHALRHHIKKDHQEEDILKKFQVLEDGRFQCSQCKFVGMHRRSIVRHVRRHKNNSKGPRKLVKSVEVAPNNFDHGGWPYILNPLTGRFHCSSCNFTFATQKKCIDHIGRCHRNRPEAFICEKCGKELSSEHSLWIHKKRHLPKSHPCPECGRLFADRGDLRDHRKIHLGEEAKKNVCEFCGKRFFKLHLLEKHRSSHTGEDPYACGDCGARFASQKELKFHDKSEHLHSI